MKRMQKGFTLIELMIVVAIIGILAAVAIPAYQDYIVKAKLAKVVTTVDPIKTALALYYQENGSFPDGTGNLQSTVASGNIWYSLGLNAVPSTIPEITQIAVDGTGLTTVKITLTLTGIKALTVDTKSLDITGFPGATNMVWRNGSVGDGTGTCATTNPVTDNIALKYFKC